MILVKKSGFILRNWWKDDGKGELLRIELIL